MILLFIGTTELLLIGGLALLMFGGKKLPEMMRGLGQGVKEFKKGMQSSGEEKTNDSEDSENTEKTESDSESEHINKPGSGIDEVPKDK